VTKRSIGTSMSCSYEEVGDHNAVPHNDKEGVCLEQLRRREPQPRGGEDAMKGKGKKLK
jgi:hypothetical protein